ncbi:hypothetical protein [Streptococcus merionis]|uniref:Phage protein n=1 Tax=Streptococcus merionis TaxID=400065 RepID=A0A239SZD4_9STRE|nr:hypothetical protein [Streptococcus merionis]QBX08767.1 hypothetical protein JavanS294_0008 [Streptococcus satellite phage Javan294]SNU90602.1 phage protein [Streptococcus merionis]
MYRIIELIISQDKLQLFSFLKQTPTRVLKNGQHFKFLYLEPLDSCLVDFYYKGLMVKVVDRLIKLNSWQVVRDYPIALASGDLIGILDDLEGNKLTKTREGQYLPFNGWLFDTITTGLYTKQDTTALIKLMFLHGYDFEQVTQVFSAIVRRKGLAGHFLATMKRIYKEVELG